MKACLTTASILFISVCLSGAGLLDFLGLGSKSANQADGVSSLSQDQVVAGLKEALQKGVQQAVSRLGHEGGFWTNLDVRIPMPEQLRTVEKTLRAVKLDKVADDFTFTMNRAAEQAVPEAASVFADAVKGMSFADAQAILMGTNNAATQYFRSHTETNLHARFLPIVKKATEQTGTTAAYKRLTEKATAGNAFGSLGKGLFSSESLDLDGYVTNRALDGLFKMLAQEERRIRENPTARTSELLQKVFGALGK